MTTKEKCCKHCSKADVELVPASGIDTAHWACPNCDSTYVEWEYPIEPVTQEASISLESSRQCAIDSNGDIICLDGLDEWTDNVDKKTARFIIELFAEKEACFECRDISPNSGKLTNEMVEQISQQFGIDSTKSEWPDIPDGWKKVEIGETIYRGDRSYDVFKREWEEIDHDENFTMCKLIRPTITRVTKAGREHHS